MKKIEPNHDNGSQSTNQPTNQLINQQINQSINQSTNKSINQSTNGPINQSIKDTINGTHRYQQAPSHFFHNFFTYGLPLALNASKAGPLKGCTTYKTRIPLLFRCVKVLRSWLVTQAASDTSLARQNCKQKQDMKELSCMEEASHFSIPHKCRWEAGGLPRSASRTERSECPPLSGVVARVVIDSVVTALGAATTYEEIIPSIDRQTNIHTKPRWGRPRISQAIYACLTYNSLKQSQSINQSINRTANQPINQSINQTIDRWTEQFCPKN